MAKKKKNKDNQQENKKVNGCWWKTLIVLTFIISIICLFLLIGRCNVSPQYKYETKLVELDNTNDFSYVNGKVVDYLCDESVTFNNHGDAYYASTSARVGDSGEFGRCLIKIRVKVE